MCPLAVIFDEARYVMVYLSHIKVNYIITGFHSVWKPFQMTCIAGLFAGRDARVFFAFAIRKEFVSVAYG